MARVYEYTRSVDAVTNESHYKKSLYKLEDVTLNRIKQEPCNVNDEDMSESSNNESTKYKSNNMSEDKYNSNKTVSCLTNKGSKDNVPDNMSGDKCDNENNVCSSSEKRKSGKRKRHERHSFGNKKKKKALQESDDNIQSYKRQEESVTCRRVSRKMNGRVDKMQTIVHCKICFLKFDSLWGLYHHEKSYERNIQRSLTVRGKSLKRGKFACNFCSRMFKIKSLVQSHLFHLHMSDLGIDVKKNSLSNKPCSNSHSHTPKKQIMRQTTLLEYMFSPEKSKYSEITNNSNVHSQAIIKQEIDLNDNEPDLSTNTSFADISEQNTMSSQITIPNQPFVKIHVHSTMMKTLLGIDENDSTKPPQNNSKNNNNSGEVEAVRSLSSSKEPSNEKLSTIVNKIKHGNIDVKVKVRDLLSICKKCSVPLARCDDKPRTKLTLQCSTPLAQVLGQNNYTSLKRKRQQSRNMNVTITPVRDTPRNTIRKSSSSINSTPKGILSFSAPLKVNMFDVRVRNNLSEQLANRRSSSKKIAPDEEEEISSEETNAMDPETSSSEEKSDFTNIRSTQPTIQLKLKELKVSLIKLPEIKKEFHESNMFCCEICEFPFLSEKRKDKHIREFHTTYISSICTARYNSKRDMLKHYLQEHCIWGYNRCCVCRKFFRSRLLLQQHLLLHCIKVILSKNERRTNMIAKCHAMSKIHKRLRTRSTKCKEIADVGQENVNVNYVENITNLADKRKANADVKITDHEKQASHINEASSEMLSSFESNVIYLSPSNEYEATELTKEPVLDPLYITNDSHISENDTRITLTPNPNTVSLHVSDGNKSVSMLPNIRVDTKQKYPCSICGKQFQKLEGLWQHKRTYTQSLQNFCTTCGMCFSNKKILRNHINSTHDFYLSKLFKYYCQFCNQGFRAETNRRIHELHYHAAVETTGKQNVAGLLQVSNFENNLNTTDNETMCNVCGRNFNSYERYQLHCMYYHKGHVFACHFCDQIFQGLYMLHHHNKLHHYPESTRFSYTYHCPICYEGFTIETHFHGHMAHVHSNKQLDVTPDQISKSSKKSYVCSKCHLEFSTIIELMVHVEHYTDGGNYQCQQCNRKCCTLAVLNEHINLSHGDRLRNDHKCDLCSEVLISSTSLLCHKKHVHQNEETSADFTLTRRTSDLSVDETESNIHDKVIPVIAGPEDELAISCESQVCTNTSTSSVSTWGKCNISCPICGVTFDKELFLKKHLTEYLDVGDYKCEKCNRRFANYEFLSKHMANHSKPGTPLTKYSCSVCNENFQSSIVYESHVAHLHASIIVTDTSSSNL